MKLVVCCLVSVLALSGCGGSSQEFTRDSVETEFTSLMRDKVAAKGGTMDPLECVQDGDQYHWRCLTHARISEQAYTLTTQITCDGDTGECISEPATISPG